MKRTTMQKNSQIGFVSIITVLFLAVLVTLFTLGFARVMIKGQQNTLNSQLNSQAFYAAETGVNDAIQAIEAGYVPPIEDTDCAPLKSVDTQLQKQIPIEYTCQLVSSGVKDIQYSALADTPRTFPIFTNGEIVTDKDITIDWENGTNYLGAGPYHPQTGGQTALPKAADWSTASNPSPAMLRITVYTMPAGASRADFNGNQKTLFLTPEKAADNDNETRINFNSAADGSVVSAHCKNLTNTRQYSCRASLNMDGTDFHPETYNRVFLRILPIYHQTNVDIYFNKANIFNETTNNKTTLFNAQYSIDSTGRANDVYRRIQVRIPYNEVTNPPNGVVSGSGFCKRYIFDKRNNRTDTGTSSIDIPSCGVY